MTTSATYDVGRSGQRTASANGYVYIYVTNESGQDVWFDDLFVTHRTGPLLQEAHFYPFGQEITPLSSKALLKTPNDRMLQQNEWDEEFGMNLHDFDARMYDASIGRFWGVDPVMESYIKTNPYQYALNNPYMYIDPDGRSPKIILAIKILAKLLAKTSKKVIAKFVLPTSKMAAPTKVAWGAGAGANIYQNRQHIGNGTVAGGIFRALGYGIAGGTGAAISMGKGALWSLGGMGAGGMLTVGWAGLTDAEGANFWQFFSRGASSAMFGKNFGKAYSKGYYANPDNNLISNYSGGEPSTWSKIMSISSDIGQKSLEKGAQSYFTKYGIYGEYGKKSYGENFYWNAFFGGMIAGAINQAGNFAADGLIKRFASSDIKSLLKGGFVLSNAYYTDGIKFNYLYNNSEKKYREFLKSSRAMTRFWSASNATGLMALFFEGAGY